MVFLFRLSYLQAELWMRLFQMSKTQPNNCFIRHCFEKEIMKTTLFSHRTQFDIARGNHAWRTQPTDKSVIYWQITTN